MKIRNGFVSNSSSSSFSVIGLKVKKDQLQQQMKVRSCKCEVKGIESMKFCPECGIPAKRDETVWLHGIVNNKLGRFNIKEGMEFGEILITIPETYMSFSDYDYSDMEVTKLTDEIFELKKELEVETTKLGLWDENQFGVWSGSEEY